MLGDDEKVKGIRLYIEKVNRKRLKRWEGRMEVGRKEGGSKRVGRKGGGSREGRSEEVGREWGRV